METKQERWVVCIDVPTAIIPGHIVKREDGACTPVACVPKGPGQTERARLIAAAPEMAALLERNQNVIMDALTSGHGITPAIADDMRAVLAEARALLAKIKGE